MAYVNRYGWRTMTKPQQLALKRLWDRYSVDGVLTTRPDEYVRSYREFRARCVNSFDCFMVRWCGMWIGIETDGYTHS